MHSEERLQVGLVGYAGPCRCGVGGEVLAPARAALGRLVRGGVDGNRFRRGVAVGGWLVDAWSPALRLAILIDDPRRPQLAPGQAFRTRVLARSDLVVLVVRGEDLLRRPRRVRDRIASLALILRVAQAPVASAPPLSLSA